MKNIVVINGVNLDMLGVREPNIYGNKTLEELYAYMKAKLAEEDVALDFFQSNYEGAIVERIHKCYFDKSDGIVLNAGAHTHYSYAIADALKAAGVRAIEVHMSDVDAREPFRHISVIQSACEAKISGSGFDGYVEAVRLLLRDKD